MFTRTRVAAGSAIAGALLVGAVATGGFAQAPTAAQAAQLDPAGFEQLMQVTPQPSPSPSPKPGGRQGPDHGRQQLTPEQQQQRRQQMQQRREQYLNRLATNLGVDRSRLEEVFRQTKIDMVNQAVQEGRLTREQADQMIQRINSGQQPGPGAHRGGR